MTNDEKWEAERDEASAAYYKEQCEHGEYNMRHMDTLEAAFDRGADWARQYTLDEILQSEELRELIEALETWVPVDGTHHDICDMTYPDNVTAGICDCGLEALGAFKAKFGQPTRGTE